MSINAKTKKIVTPGATSTTLTVGASDSICLFDGATEAYILPTIATIDVGTTFTFLVTVAANTAQTVTAAAADLMIGGVVIWDDTAAYTAPQSVVLKADVSNDVIFTMNGTTKGGKVGSVVKFTAVTGARWFVEGCLFGSGVIATPFS